VAIMSVSHKIAVLTVDDHPLLRSGIAAVIQGEQDMLVVGEATNGQEAIEAFRVHQPDVTLMDLQMPMMNGIDAILAIRREFPGARFVVLTTYHGDVQALRALKAGAMGYLLKNMLREELINTVRAVHAGRDPSQLRSLWRSRSMSSMMPLRTVRSPFCEESPREPPTK
jgi:DNA-binding NarL/FixJ family response regulator